MQTFVNPYNDHIINVHRTVGKEFGLILLHFYLQAKSAFCTSPCRIYRSQSFPLNHPRMTLQYAIFVHHCGVVFAKGFML